MLFLPRTLLSTWRRTVNKNPFLSVFWVPVEPRRLHKSNSNSVILHISCLWIMYILHNLLNFLTFCENAKLIIRYRQILNSTSGKIAQDRRPGWTVGCCEFPLRKFLVGSTLSQPKSGVIKFSTLTDHQDLMGHLLSAGITGNKATQYFTFNWHFCWCLRKHKSESQFFFSLYAILYSVLLSHVVTWDAK